MLQALFGFLTRRNETSSPGMNDSLFSWVYNRFKWCPTSVEALENAEKKILSYLKKPFNLKYVVIKDNTNKRSQNIRTISLNEKNPNGKMSLVMLHGLGSAIGLWVLNLDALAADRPVYGIDILGFGLSSRPPVRGSAAEIEDQLVESIELWRKEMKLDRFILLGHSMGGYLASAYALRYPDRIGHLILADPWGFPAEQGQITKRIHLPFWIRGIAKVLQYFNPMTGLRVAGPWGPGLITKVRPDILQKFGGVVDDLEVVSNYIYHCNVQSPSGEIAFKALSYHFGWAKLPMVPRMANLREDINISFIYGSKSWVDSQSGHAVKEMRSNSRVTIREIIGAGHHVYADQMDDFNDYVVKTCRSIDDALYGVAGPSNVAKETVKQAEEVVDDSDSMLLHGQHIDVFS